MRSRDDTSVSRSLTVMSNYSLSAYINGQHSASSDVPEVLVMILRLMMSVMILMQIIGMMN